MCDCYTGKCVTCGCDVSMHIADFCTDRDNVHVYCHRCARKVKKSGVPESKQIIWEAITSKRQVEGGKKGEEVLILCDDPKAYGIHLN